MLFAGRKPPPGPQTSELIQEKCNVQSRSHPCAPGISQGLPGTAGSCQELPGAARSCQELLRKKELVRVVRICQELQGAAKRSCQEKLPGIGRGYMEFQGAAWNYQELQGVAGIC